MRFKEVTTNQDYPYNETLWSCEDSGNYFKLIDEQKDKWQIIRKDSDVFKLKEVRSGFKFEIGKYTSKIYRS